ncbi:hypothetical protein SAMN04488564_104621 [Lentzea waywayandensis]|uniref:Uncharacterized protein n=1 Tax=Lentzea waywayandensis TaxID=84724 RepID=A0A1I6EJA6_9PSEU|nr:hypothetical protein SAMN04488564_104621 [Lentzea waywayandensis]
MLKIIKNNKKLRLNPPSQQPRAGSWALAGLLSGLSHGAGRWIFDKSMRLVEFIFNG